MVVEVAAKFKVLGKAAVVQHAAGIATNGEGFATCNGVVFIGDKGNGLVGDAAVMNQPLASVFAV